jgi:hypothetical protein
MTTDDHIPEERNRMSPEASKNTRDAFQGSADITRETALEAARVLSFPITDIDDPTKVFDFYAERYDHPAYRIEFRVLAFTALRLWTAKLPTDTE